MRCGATRPDHGLHKDPKVHLGLYRPGRPWGGVGAKRLGRDPQCVFRRRDPMVNKGLLPR
jgi:hypothetical protein